MFAIIDEPKRVVLRDLWENKKLLVLVITILLSVFAHGRLLDNRKGSKILDSLRLIVVAIAIPFVYSTTGVAGWIGPAIWVFTAGMMIWLWSNTKTHLPRLNSKLKTQGI